MKKVTIVLAALVALVINLNSVFASETTTDKSENLKMCEAITNVYYSAPSQDLMNEEIETLTIHFRINQDHEFELIKVEGKNPDLVRYSTITFTILFVSIWHSL